MNLTIESRGSNAVMGASFQNDATILYPTKSAKQRALKERMLSGLQFRLPAVVKSYDYNTNIAEVGIATRKKTTHKDDDGNFIDMDYPIYRVRVRQPMSNINGGGVGIILPISEGDSGWIEAADRNCEEYFSNPMKMQDSSDDFGMFLFRYGCFTPSVWTPNKDLGWKLLEEDKGCISIRNSEGDVRIVLNPETKEIRIITPSKISCETPSVEMSGNLTVSGTIHADGDITSSGISVQGHVHGGVQTGSGDTSTPH